MIKNRSGYQIPQTALNFIEAIRETGDEEYADLLEHCVEYFMNHEYMGCTPEDISEVVLVSLQIVNFGIKGRV